MPEVFKWYVESVGLSDCNCLYPRFGNAGGGKIVAQGEYMVGYSTVAAQLKEVEAATLSECDVNSRG